MDLSHIHLQGEAKLIQNMCLVHLNVQLQVWRFSFCSWGKLRAGTWWHCWDGLQSQPSWAKATNSLRTNIYIYMSGPGVAIGVKSSYKWSSSFFFIFWTPGEFTTSYQRPDDDRRVFDQVPATFDCKLPERHVDSIKKRLPPFPNCTCTAFDHSKYGFGHMWGDFMGWQLLT